MRAESDVAPLPYGSAPDGEGIELSNWNAWRALRSRAHIILVWRDVPESAGGAYLMRAPEGTAVVLDRRLNRQERHAALTHELVHEERGPLPTMSGMAPDWLHVVHREERFVRRITADRIVPVADLAAFCDRMADLGEGVGPDEVMDEFDCTRRVAEDAFDNLTRHERGR